MAVKGRHFDPLSNRRRTRYCPRPRRGEQPLPWTNVPIRRIHGRGSENVNTRAGFCTMSLWIWGSVSPSSLSRGRNCSWMNV